MKIKKITIVGKNNCNYFCVGSNPDPHLKISKIKLLKDYNNYHTYEIYDENDKLKFTVENCSVVIEYFTEE